MASVVCNVLLHRITSALLSFVAREQYMTYPSSVWRIWICSSTRITLTWSRFLVVQRMTLPRGSTSLSSSTHDSALWIMPLGAHLGSEPVLRMRRVVRSEPEGVSSRDMTSQERIWVE